MAQLTLTDKKAREIYPKADAEMKAILEESFGGKEFFHQKITDRVKTFEDACGITGHNSTYTGFTSGDPDEIAYKKLKVIVQALNEGWEPNWNNSGQRKWAPWFYLDNPGFRFGDSGCDWSTTHSAGGSRLCYASEELASYAAKQFLSIYKDFLS